jgi:cysteine synthase
MYRVAENMVDLVGYAPMVKINDIVPNKNVKVYAKLTIYT